MVNLVFTATATADPAVRIAPNGNTIAIVRVQVQSQPHLPPIAIQVVAVGKQAIYAHRVIKKDCLLFVSGWFVVGQNKNGNEFLEVRAKQLRALII